MVKIALDQWPTMDVYNDVYFLVNTHEDWLYEIVETHGFSATTME